MDELMLKIENVKKQYKLGQIGGTTLREELQRLHAKIHKKEDPTKKIGAKDYNRGEKFMALDGVSFEVKKGERVGIIGHNGAGKSTLLKLISRITAPTEGTISLNGRVASMLEVGTGFHQELTGRENIYMNGAILGMTKKEIDEKMEDIIEFSEVRQFIDTPVKRYSSGMYVKLAFSVAAHLDSEIMIMDEVLAVGDAQFQHKCIEKMRSEALDHDKTILYVSHNMNTIRQLCSRVIVLDHGKVVHDGDVEEGINRYIGLSKVEYCQHYSLVENQRPRWKDSGLASLLSVDLLDTDNNIYNEGDRIKISLEYDSKVESDRLRLMLIFFRLDETRIAMSESDFFSCKKGVNRVVAEIPTDCFITDEYKVELSIFDYQGGVGMRHDCAKDAFYFKVHTEEKGIVADNWRVQTFGRMHAKDIKVIKSE